MVHQRQQTFSNVLRSFAERALWRWMGARLAVASCWHTVSQQRGHVPLQVASLCFRATSPLSPVRRAAFPVSARGAAAPRAGARKGAWSVLRSMAVRALWRWVLPRLAAHRGWHPSSTAGGALQLRQNYIKRHYTKWSPVSREAPFVASTAGTPFGFIQHFLCKIAYAGPGVSAVCTPQPLRV